MCTCADASSGCTSDSIDCLGMSVTTIDTRQRRVIDGFDAVFDEKESVVIEVFEIIQECIGHTVRTSAYDKPNDIRDGEGFLIFGFEVLEGIVGVGVCLKVSEELHVRIFAGEEMLALLQLPGD